MDESSGQREVDALKRRQASVAADAETADIALAASGDARAFERLYQAHVGRVHSLGRRMVGPDDADEVTQDVFVRAWEKLDSFRGESAFGTWLHRLAINVMLARRAKRGRWQSRHVSDEALAVPPTAPRRSPETRIDLEAAIATLPDGARQVFVLHDVEGFKHREIAEMLGVTAGTSKAQLHRARMALRTHIDR